MDPNLKESAPKIVWHNIIFFVTTTSVAVIGGPWYVIRYGVPVFELWFTVFYIFLTGIGITAGYHRLFSHSTYRAHPVVQAILLFFGSAAFEQSALTWSSQHRDHHNFTAKKGDPYSISEGFFYAHIGWLMFWRHPFHYENVKDLQRNKLVMHQHRYSTFYMFLAGVVMPLGFGLIWGNMLASFIFSVCARIVFVHHATWSVNSVCHWFGREPYDLESTARDNWLVALVTNGEGFHNYHHRFPSDFRNGIHWYEWDPTKWLIWLLSSIGFTWNLKEATEFRILEAKLLVRQQLIRRQAQADRRRFVSNRFFGDFEKVYQTLRSRLFIWENKKKEYDRLSQAPKSDASELERQLAQTSMNLSKKRFNQTYRLRQRYLKSRKKFSR